VIRRLLRLPEGDPPLPEGDPNSVSVWKPDDGYLRYRLFLFVVAGLPAMLGFFGMLAFGGIAVMVGLEGDAPPLPVQVLIAAGLGLVALRTLVGLGFGFYRIRLEMDMLRYVLTDQAVRLRRGVTEIEEITLSFANIQNVKMNQGFLQRVFGIADLIVETAGGGGGAEVGGHVGRILGVGEPDALREAILERARAFKGSGLGQVTRRAAPAVVAAPGLSDPRVAALLGEIVADLRAVRLRDRTSAPPQAPEPGT